MTSPTIEQGVLEVLEKHPEAKNSYNWLWYWYCREICGINLFMPFEVLNDRKRIPSLESVSRVCGKIQNEMLSFRPAFEVIKARENNEIRVREWALKTRKFTQNLTKNYNPESVNNST